MPIKDHINNKNYLEKLPNIALIPWHLDNEITHPYPLCGKREIFCGPKLQNKDTLRRKYIRTNGRFFDIDDVISQLNENDQKIDLFFSILEATSTCYPKNVFKINCPKLAYIGDTFHIMNPISTIINYLKKERIEHILVGGQPAHLHFFYEAGIKHAAFAPRIKAKFETVNNKKPGLTYIGKRWKSSHLRKSRMVQFLEKELPKNNVPYNYYTRLPTPLWRKVLTHSKMVAVSSLNGQVTPQIYNCLSAGALCFADEISSQTFIYQFLEPGVHFITWRNNEDLLNKIIYYYNHPTEADVIAKAGKLQAEKNYPTSESLAKFITEFVFENNIDPHLLAINDDRCQQKRIETQEYFDARVRLYENIQELHRIHESLTLISLTEKNLNPSVDLADLPRLNITHAFISNKSKNEANLYFQRVGVSHQISTALLNKVQKTNSYDIGILEKLENLTDWKFLTKSISKLLKSNSLLWVLGKLTLAEKEILEKEGFKHFTLHMNPLLLKIKKLTRKICLQFWKLGLYPLPYLTLKPSMEMVPNLNVFLRGWQSYFPFLY